MSIQVESTVVHVVRKLTPALAATPTLGAVVESALLAPAVAVISVPANSSQEKQVTAAAVTGSELFLLPAAQPSNLLGQSPSYTALGGEIPTAVNTEVQSFSVATSPPLVRLKPMPRIVTDEVKRATRLRGLFDEFRHLDATSAIKSFAYRVARRSWGVRIAYVLSLELAEVPQPTSSLSGLEYRWLTAADIRAYGADLTNELDSSMAERLETDDNCCFAALDGPRLASYSWFAPDSIEPEHSFDVGITYSPNTRYLFKAFTHPRYRGRGIYQSLVSRASRYFADRGVSRLFALVEYANWVSLNAHTKFGFANVGWLATAGRPPFQFERYPQIEDTLGIRFGNHA